jgi:predicted Zn-dependent peptidase
VHPQSPRPARRRVHYRADVFELQRFSNGTRLLTAPQSEAQSTCVMVMYAVGSRYESDETGGISHFAEHLFFKGTERRPTARDIASEIDGIGAEFNAFTGKEYTGYYVKCAKEHVPIAIDVLGDMLLHSLFDAEEIEREKGVIVEEMNMYVDTPTAYLPSVYDRLCYGDTPLGRDIIGTKETVGAATRETFMRHLARWYVPSRTVIGLGGAVTDTARKLIEGLFGTLPAAESDAPAPWKPEPHPRVRIHHKDSDSLHLRIGGDGLPLLHPDRYAASVLSAVLGGGMSSRLFTEVRERRGLAYYISAQHGQYVEAGSLFSQAGVDIKRADEAVTTIVAELQRIVNEPVPDDELTKARNLLKGRLVLGLEDPRSIVGFGLRATLLEGAPREVPDVLAGYDAVTAEDVARVAQTLLAPEKLRIAAIGPIDDGARFEALLA